MRPSEKIFDVCVIGSGPAGGVLSKELAEAGAKVALVEAGRPMMAEDFNYHAWPYQFPNRQKPEPFYPPEVRSAIRYDDCDNISVDRIRAVGGRSIHWNAACFRFSARDFQEASLEGVEADWPITYDELAPYYSYVEKMIGVCGSRENLDVIPDGEFLPPLKLRCSEEIVKRSCDRMGIRMIPTRKAVLTVPYDNRPPCHYCGHCMEGCDVGAIFTVPNSMIPKAQKTGNFTLIPNKLAREILVDTAGKARAVSVIDTVTRREGEIRARRFAVCCATIESARLLLNSRSPRFPNGLANSSDCVGRYLAGHVGMGIYGYLDELVGTPPINNDGATDHSYIPRFNLGQKKKDFVGGYQYQVQFSSFMFPHHASHVKGFGPQFKKQVRFLQPGLFQMGGFGKVLAQPENRVTVDPTHSDAYGIPIPVVHFRFSENDNALWRDMKMQAEEILSAAKCRLIINDDPSPSGFASHETGTVRMGKDPRTSVLNAYNQAHDVSNLFVVDGSCFTTFPEKNPTLTIMALAVRTARHMAEGVRKGDL
ncbi:MAG TPA: GMC family oxidoreductase [Terriglobia bacterium]|nr:GMC family oxidoreductase [Terriglobia bacterium]